MFGAITRKTMGIEDKIKEKLLAAFKPLSLEIQNDSHKHAHHVAMHGVEKTGETHFTVKIISEAFSGRSRVERHRMVHEVLAEELAGPVHALAVKADAPAASGS